MKSSVILRFLVLTVSVCCDAAFFSYTRNSLATKKIGQLSKTSSSLEALDLAVVGCGVLGTSLCKQILSLDCDARIIGITNTKNNHESIIREVLDDSSNNCRNFSVDTYKSADTRGRKYSNVVFCAPPSGSDDYSADVADAINKLWIGPEGGGVFVFTSSGGVYADDTNSAIFDVNEKSTLLDVDTNPRAGRLIRAENACLLHGGTVIRLAGLYNINRGAHNYWIEKGEVAGAENGLINQLHYDDAASACIAAVMTDSELVQSQVFLISDGSPMTRKSICSSALKNALYQQKKMPQFLGNSNNIDTADPVGKVYKEEFSNQVLSWKPKYSSFDSFMTSKI
eukprot:CAMPEP_0194270892 /NCGR_PEP_ID=MMETSP0169-20130528/4799_1 /TAXON_ID=218684 /ORGANISM="Corethron pennatum, Strain L29A3" /LENGTH=339 /DNA_ID=CAMNT_0039013099 /DNA_START=84 /DNA_END=1103 /DNA_ORIENTATION=+